MSKGYIAFKCTECGYISLFSESKADGNRCIECGCHIIPIGKAGIDMDDQKNIEINMSEKGLLRALRIFNIHQKDYEKEKTIPPSL